LAAGNLNFLRVSSRTLLQASHPQLRALAQDYRQRAAHLEDEALRAEAGVMSSLQ
jgi:hypothetical protein